MTSSKRCCMRGRCLDRPHDRASRRAGGGAAGMAAGPVEHTLAGHEVVTVASGREAHPMDTRELVAQHRWCVLCIALAVAVNGSGLGGAPPRTGWAALPCV